VTDETTPALRYYDAKQIGILTFIFGPFAGVYLLWRNWKTFGDNNKAVHTVIAGVAVTLIVSKFADHLPDAVWLVIFVCFGYSGFFAWLAHAWQGTVIDALKAKGLPRGSSWRFCKIGIVLLAAYALIDALI
jgi:hypothetical protein